jgi:CRP-like cAMP-binding protein
LDDEILRALAEHCEYRELPAGVTLFEQGAPGDALYLLQTGQVHIVRQHPDGEQVILATEGPYYVIGDLSMIADQPRTGAVVAVSDCGLIRLDRDSFCRACDRYPGLAFSVMTYLGRRLYRMNLQVREFAIGNVAARVASVILLLSGSANGASTGQIHVSRVARAAATDADVVERLLASWANEGYLTFDGRQVTLHAIETLRAIAG